MSSPCRTTDSVRDTVTKNLLSNKIMYLKLARPLSRSAICLDLKMQEVPDSIGLSHCHGAKAENGPRRKRGYLLMG
jgi:hypothetical protein